MSFIPRVFKRNFLICFPKNPCHSSSRRKVDTEWTSRRIVRWSFFVSLVLFLLADLSGREVVRNEKENGQSVCGASRHSD